MTPDHSLARRPHGGRGFFVWPKRIATARAKHPCAPNAPRAAIPIEPVIFESWLTVGHNPNSAHTLMDGALLRRAANALYGMLIADALAMPVHWFYNPADITKQFGTIRDFQPAPAFHPSSIMNLHSTSSGGRGGQGGSVIGDVILKGKKQFWGRPNMHYHNGMRAGENTLNALVARLLVRNIARTRTYSPEAFISDYVAFMTTPDSHNDTYAESYHRDFFANYAAGVPAMKCAGKEGHDTASVGGLVLVPPVVIFTYATTMNRDAAAAAGLTQMRLTHRSSKLDQHATIYIDCLIDILSGVSVIEATRAAGSRIGIDLPKLVARSSSDRDVCGGMFGLACYIEHSLPVLLFLAHKYHDNPEQALIANANIGGENCHRGAALAALVGSGSSADGFWPSRWMQGLHDKRAIDLEIQIYLSSFGHVDQTKSDL